MFEAAELGQKFTREQFAAALPQLRSELLNAHLQLRQQKFPVIVIISGADGAGKGELVHRLNEWLDPRGVATHAFWQPSDEELERPPYWRFWRAMPGRGRIGVFFGSWYTAPIVRRARREIKSAEFESALDRIVRFEKMLTDDGAVLVKLWLHLSKKTQKKRLRKLQKQGRIAPDDWRNFKLYDRFIEASERAIRHSDLSLAPWHVIEATDRAYREITAGRAVLEAIQLGIKRSVRQAGSERVSDALARRADTLRSRKRSILDGVDLSRRLSDAEYDKALEREQANLSRLAWAAHQQKRSMIIVMEGWDAAGKGSAIRRVTQAMDPRLYQVIGIAAPTDEERAQHYLWRFWRHLPRAGFTTVFDRSWYGRVLVERVEGFASPAEWSRAYQEINEFEEQLSDHGLILAKFWIHLSSAEQLRRFKERQTIPYKQFKITEEDWRNRKKWADYKKAVDDMVARCSTCHAPWTLVAGEDKRFARVQILKTIVGRLEDAL